MNLVWTAAIAACGLLLGTCDTASVPCNWYPSVEFIDVALRCTGPRVKRPPRSLPDSLQHLRLCGTLVRTLQAATFEGTALPALTSLYLTNGVLETVEPGALCSLPAISVLDLSNNTLKELDASSFSCNQHLRVLSLSGNPGLERLPELVSTSIETLFLESSNLRTVDANALAGLPALRHLHLAGGPGFDCLSVKQRVAEARPSVVVSCGTRTGEISYRKPVPLKYTDGYFSSGSTVVVSASSSANISKAVSLATTIIVALLVRHGAV